MSQSAIIDDAIKLAQEVLDTAPGQALNIKHNFNYLSKTSKSNKNKNLPSQSRIVYASPGQARLLELKVPPRDQRVGRFPQHNTPGAFQTGIQVLASLTLDKYRDLHSVFSLEEAGFKPHKATLTKKKIANLANQFAHLSSECFKEMLCLQSEVEKRDFDVWVREVEGEIMIAYINPHNFLIQFMQSVFLDESGAVCDLRHVVYETSIPLVINQTCIDKDGRTRNIAHVGVTGSTSNSFVNSLERFDDGTIMWTTSDFKFGKNVVGSAVLKDDGEVILLPGLNKELTEFSARNLGAEGIDTKTQSWIGKFSPEACVPESHDKYIVRREYKTSVRKQVNQIVDGACIPGLTPIFPISTLENTSFTG